MDNNKDKILDGDNYFYNDHPSQEHFRRDLSGIYFLDKFPNEEKRLPTCFEDCTVEKQEEILNSKDLEWVKSLALLLSRKLKEIGKQFDIVSENS